MKIKIEKEIEDKLQWFVNNYDEEISGWLTGKITKDEIHIKELLIPYQEVSGASVDTEGEDLIKLRKEYGKKCTKIIGHWHSHNTMSNSFSTTDEEFMEQYMKNAKIMLFLVTNKEDGHRTRLEIREPYNLSITGYKMEIVGEEEDKIAKELKEEIKKKIRKKKIVIKNTFKGWKKRRKKEQEIENEYDSRKQQFKIYDLEPTIKEMFMQAYSQYEFTLKETRKGKDSLIIECTKQVANEMLDTIIQLNLMYGKNGFSESREDIQSLYGW